MRRGRRIALACLVAALVAAPVANATKPKPKPNPTLGIVFPEGFTAQQMVGRVGAVRAIAIKQRHVRPALTEKGYAAALKQVAPPAGFGATSLEGFLFPDRYDFGASTTPAQLIRLQLRNFGRKWATVDLTAATAKGLTPYQVLIVASMIEREVAVPSERALVSAVIYNRLAQKMPLGIDAALRYGLHIPPDQSITAAELADPTPYNTRLHTGLPPTPISNPGFAALQAAAAPAGVDYLYYVRIPGTSPPSHYFTADYADFCVHVQEYGYAGC